MRPLAQLRRVRSRAVVVIGVALVWLGAMCALAAILSASQAHARRDVAQRLEARTAAGAEFASLYVRDIFARERVQAASWLMVREPTPLGVARAARAVGFAASVLLDHDGRVLQAVPAKPGLVGEVISARYPHLAAAVAGRAAVSNVVRSAARGVPVVGFALPFATGAGRRVFSGAFDVSNTPLGAYMSHLLVIPGRRVYLVDATGSMIADSGPRLRSAENLSQMDGRLASLARVRSSGSYTSRRGRQFFVTAAVAGTPWRIVVAVPEDQLYISLNGSSRSLAWLAVAGLAIAGLMIILMGARLLHSRTRLTTLNGDLDRLSRIDSLTDLRNRRDIEETLVGALSAARRHEADLAVLLIDIDHFKLVNDTYGHQVGDAVLTRTGLAIQSALRSEDTVGRWGGEEFLVVLPHTDAAGAVVIADRLRVRVRVAMPDPDHSEPRIAVTVTIGAAAWTAGGMDELISRADRALYAGKAAGRNNVQVAASEPNDIVSAQ